MLSEWTGTAQCPSKKGLPFPEIIKFLAKTEKGTKLFFFLKKTVNQTALAATQAARLPQHRGTRSPAMRDSDQHHALCGTGGKEERPSPPLPACSSRQAVRNQPVCSNAVSAPPNPISESQLRTPSHSYVLHQNPEPVAAKGKEAAGSSTALMLPSLFCLSPLPPLLSDRPNATQLPRPR